MSPDRRLRRWMEVLPYHAVRIVRSLATANATASSRLSREIVLTRVHRDLAGALRAARRLRWGARLSQIALAGRLHRLTRRRSRAFRDALASTWDGLFAAPPLILDLEVAMQDNARPPALEPLREALRDVLGQCRRLLDEATSSASATDGPGPCAHGR